jgi:hypothetical protein
MVDTGERVDTVDTAVVRPSVSAPVEVEVRRATRGCAFSMAASTARTPAFAGRRVGVIIQQQNRDDDAHVVIRSHPLSTSRTRRDDSRRAHTRRAGIVHQSMFLKECRR